MIWLRQAWTALTSRPAFFLCGVLVAALVLNGMNSWFSRQATSSVSPSQPTRRVRSAPSVEIKPPIVKAPSLKPKVAAAIERDYNLGKGSVTTAADIVLGTLSDKTVLDEVETKHPLPEGSEVKAIAVLDKSGKTDIILVDRLPWYSFNQRVGVGLGLRETGIPSGLQDEFDFKDGIDAYLLWEPLHFPKWRSHLRLTVRPVSFSRVEDIEYGLHLEYRGD